MTQREVPSPFVEVIEALAVGQSVPFGMSGLVHIWGRNDMSTTQRLGIHWVVTDPDAIVVEDYSTWEAWPYASPGAEKEFIGGRFPMNKAGNWSIEVELLMNPDNLVIVDRYMGLLAVVAPAPEFAGTITRKELEYDSTRGDIPVE